MITQLYGPETGSDAAARMSSRLIRAWDHCVQTGDSARMDRLCAELEGWPAALVERVHDEVREHIDLVLGGMFERDPERFLRVLYGTKETR